MKRPWLIVAAWLLLLVPTLLIGALALRLLRHEQERIEGAALAAVSRRARNVVETIDLAVTEVKGGLLETLSNSPQAGLADRLEEWKRHNPLIRNVFIWDPEEGLLLPDPKRPANEEEASFLRRYDTLFEGRAVWADRQTPPEVIRPESTASVQYTQRKELRLLTKPSSAVASRVSSEEVATPASRDSGWIPWFWESRLHFLGWVEPTPSGRRYGVELEMMALLARLISALPGSPPGGEAYALVDGNGQIFYQTGATAIDVSTLQLAAVPIGGELPHWQVAVYASGDSPADLGGGSFLLLSTLVVGSFVVAILFGGSLLLWQAYRNLLDARRKTTFVSNVSHELKTPLTTIRMYSELLREGRVRSDDKKRHYLEVIVSESQRLTRLVNNVLDFSRLELGRKNYTVSSLDLSAAIAALLDTLIPRLQGAGIRLERRLPDAPVAVRADRDALEQVFLNLLDNAIKYASDGGEIAVELACEDGTCRVRVLDRGPGVPTNHRRRIFEKFHRVDDSLTARQPGSGLGLSIARQIIEDLGGRLTYHSREGGGACFEVTLPAEDRRET